MRNTAVVIAVMMVTCVCFGVVAFSQDDGHDWGGEELLGKYPYEDYEKPEKCLSCHVDIYRQWEQSMMAQAYTHHWDEIEYFELAVAHGEVDPDMKSVADGCNGCHAPLAFTAGDVPPPRPSEGSRANEAVSCDVCHTIKGHKGDTPYNFSYIIKPGSVKYGNREGVESPEHKTVYLDYIESAELCANCHNEQSPFGVWVKATYNEWAEGPYKEDGVPCHVCHMPTAPGRNAKMADKKYDDIGQHLFHGAHVESKIKGAIEMRIHPDVRETEPGYPVIMSVQLFNGKCGHKVPSGSVEDRIMWLHVEATDAEGNTHHLPVDEKGFDGEEYTIAADVLAYQDMGPVLKKANFEGVQRDGVPVGDRIFRMPYFDPQGRMTIMQWNTKSLGVDYRIGPRETKIETYTWHLPSDLPEGMVTVKATLYYSLLVRPVGELLDVPEEELKPTEISSAETEFEIYW